MWIAQDFCSYLTAALEPNSTLHHILVLVFLDLGYIVQVKIMKIKLSIIMQATVTWIIQNWLIWYSDPYKT